MCSRAAKSGCGRAGVGAGVGGVGVVWTREVGVGRGAGGGGEGGGVAVGRNRHRHMPALPARAPRHSGGPLAPLPNAEGSAPTGKGLRVGGGSHALHSSMHAGSRPPRQHQHLGESACKWKRLHPAQTASPRAWCWALTGTRSSPAAWRPRPACRTALRQCCWPWRSPCTPNRAVQPPKTVA